MTTGAQVGGDLGLGAADGRGQPGDEVVDLTLELGGPPGQVVGPTLVGRARLAEQDVGVGQGVATLVEAL